MKQIELTEQNANEVLSGANVIVDFFADWCGPCKLLSKNIDEVAPQINDNIVLAKCDCEKQTELTDKYGIQNLPTILHLKNGEVVERHVGLLSKTEFIAFAIR